MKEKESKRKIKPYIFTSIITAVITIAITIISIVIYNSSTTKKETTYTSYYWVNNVYLETNYSNIQKLYHLKYLKISISKQDYSNEEILITYDQSYSNKNSLTTSFGLYNDNQLGFGLLPLSTNMVPICDNKDITLNSNINLKNYDGIINFNIIIYIEDDNGTKYNFDKNYRFKMKEKNDKILFTNEANDNYLEKVTFNGINLDNYEYSASITIKKRIWKENQNNSGWIN